jgi:hypothetical protein
MRNNKKVGQACDHGPLMMSIAAQRGGHASSALAGGEGDLREKWDGETWRPLFRILGRLAAGWKLVACPLDLLGNLFASSYMFCLLCNNSVFKLIPYPFFGRICHVCCERAVDSGEWQPTLTARDPSP